MACSITFSRQLVLSLPFLLPSWPVLGALVYRRYQSSYRRTKQRLRVKPDASFGPATAQFLDHIIHNPPSCAPSVYHTPTKFLPPEDVRRRLRADSPTYESNQEERLPLVFRTTQERKQHLTHQDIVEMRRLRQEDPMIWSRYKLAKRFGCSPLFVGMATEAGAQKKEMQKQVLEAVKSRWGKKRILSREDRSLRQAVWARDR